MTSYVADRDENNVKKDQPKHDSTIDNNGQQEKLLGNGTQDPEIELSFETPSTPPPQLSTSGIKIVTPHEVKPHLKAASWKKTRKKESTIYSFSKYTSKR